MAPALDIVGVPNAVTGMKPVGAPTPARLRISVAFSGFPGPFNPVRIRRLLEQRFEIVESPTPDYVIHSVFSSDFLEYPDAIRIFFTGENVRPDFNLCDYAFGYDWLEFGDRYFRCPNYQLYDHFKELCSRRRTCIPGLPQRRRFCNFIYTNGAAHPYRDRFFHALSQYREVHSAGAHLRNCDDRIGDAYNGDWCTPKVEYQRGFRFSIAFENSSSSGYTTEKIVHALAADTIPIYWGNPDVGREFNPRRIVNCHEYDSIEAIIARVRELDSNEDLYRATLAEPYFPNDRVPVELQDEKVLDQFEAIFRQPRERAFRRNRHAWGKRYEDERRGAVRSERFLQSRHPLARSARALYRAWRVLGGETRSRPDAS